MKIKYQISAQTRLVRKFLKVVGGAILRSISHMDVRGLENIPKEGSYVVVFNHVSIFDPPVLLSVWPTDPEVVGATDVWTRRGHDILARLWKAIPINRGEVDRAAMETILSVLRAGRPLLLAPEGTRSHVPGMQNAKPGVVYIIEATQTRILPVGVTGTTSDFLKQVFKGKRPNIGVNIGEPFELSALQMNDLPPKEIRQRKVDMIMRRIADLLPKEYHGVYANLAT
jgi:1-acyl-sn-glycerol-3-phosphate acyltransferase